MPFRIIEMSFETGMEFPSIVLIPWIFGKTILWSLGDKANCGDGVTSGVHLAIYVQDEMIKEKLREIDRYKKKSPSSGNELAKASMRRRW